MPNWLLPLLDRIGLVLGPVFGFVSAWLLFELTERRKRKLAQESMRRTLIAELRQCELILSSFAIGFAHGAQDVARGVDEIQWFLDHGVERSRFTGPGPTAEQIEQLEHFRNVPKEQVADMLRQRPSVLQGRALEMRLPVLDAILAAPAFGFGDSETQALSAVRWQLQMLSNEAQVIPDMVRLTFTVDDPHNHAEVVGNLKNLREGYRRRAAVALDTVRSALRALES